MAVNDLAASAVAGTYTPELLLAGDIPLKTDAAPAGADVTKYQLCALLATGVVPYVIADHTAAQAVVAMQAAVSGAQCVYASAGYFNHEAITWPGTGTALDSYAKRRAFFNGTGLRFGHITN